MAKPTQGDAHVNAPLTQISIAYIQDQRMAFIADRVFPIVPVEKQSDAYFTYGREDWWRIEAKPRGPATESAGGGFSLGTDTYLAKVYAFHKDVDDQLRANADAALNVDRDATEYVSNQLLMLRERTWTDAYFKAGVWSGDQTGVAAAPGANQFLQWNDLASSPIEDVRKQAITIQERTGRKPNKLVLGPRVLVALVDHPDLIDRIKYTQRGIITPELLAPVFDVDEVLIPNAVQNTAAEGLAGSYSFLYGKAALLTFAAPRPSLLQPSAGYFFSWTGLLGSGAFGVRMKSFRMEQLEADRVEGEMAFDAKLVGADLSVFFASAVA